MLVIVVFTAAGMSIYTMLIKKSDIQVISQNIGKLKKECEQYANMNGYSFNTISGAAMQQQGLIPSNWGTNGNWAYTPSNAGLVNYWIGVGPWGINSAFAVGVQGTSGFTLTNAGALKLCNLFSNQISQFGYNGSAYNVNNATSCNVIPNNNAEVPAGDQFFLGFE